MKKIEEFDCYIILENGTIFNMVTGNILKHSLGKNGYYRVNLSQNGRKKLFNVHRLLAKYYLKDFCEELQVDHIDGNKLNNNISNLRMATKSQNMRNTGLQKNNTSGYRGVSFHKTSGKYLSRIVSDNKVIYLGIYKTAKEASDVYEKKAKELFGEYKRRTK